MINYIDTHIHLDLLDDIKKTIDYIETNYIYVIAMTNHPKVYESLAQQIDSKYLRVALGMHPELIDKANISLFEKYVHSTKYIGEVGLDFSKKYNNQDMQNYFFNEILRRSKNKILSIHSRNAEAEVLNTIEQNFYSDSTYIMHWYTGNKKNLIRAIELGCYFSINLNMVESKKIQKMLSLFPIDKILIESDAPFSKGNIYNIQSTYYSLSKIFNIPEHIFSAQIFENFRRVLNKSIY